MHRAWLVVTTAATAAAAAAGPSDLPTEPLDDRRASRVGAFGTDDPRGTPRRRRGALARTSSAAPSHGRVPRRPRTDEFRGGVVARPSPQAQADP